MRKNEREGLSRTLSEILRRLDALEARQGGGEEDFLAGIRNLLSYAPKNPDKEERHGG